MSISDLLIRLSDADIRVRVIDNSLRVTNASNLTDELRRSLRGHRDQLIRELSLPLTDYAILLFDGVEISRSGKRIKAKQTNGNLLETIF